MFNYYGKDERTDRERYLEQELEDTRRAENERYEQQEREREQRRREWEEERRYEERQADSWPEAFAKQARLCWHEHNMFPEQNEEDDYFKQVAEANEKALVIWREVSKSKQSQIDELQKQIEAVRDSIRNEVAYQIEKASEHYAYKGTAQQIRDDDLGRYLDW